LNLGQFDCFTFILYSLGELRFLVLWCTGGRCTMACSYKDRGRSRRPDSEDWEWYTGRLLSGWVIERSGGTV
jgi:hypothetical protein